ncbi:MAG TPA: SapC family protein [Steroidobacteraceae bacterium]
MPQHALLNNVHHKDLRIVTRRAALYGDDIMASPTFPAEFRSVQAHYPIVFHSTEQGEFVPLALFGLREKQNLFLGESGWDAPYIPLMVERVPFLIGRGPNSEQVIHVDLDSPRISRTEGERVFLEHGGNSEFLDRMSSILATIHQGLVATNPFVAALVENELLESFALDIQFRDGTQHRLTGFHTIREERLAKLGSEALGKLHEKGFLQAIFMVIASLSHFRDLIERASRLDAAARA